MRILFKQYSDEDLKKLRLVLKDMLKDFISVCDKYNLSYIVDGGTLIGTIRHKGFIPWDDDVDVAMPRKDYDVLLSVLEKEMGDKYSIANPNRTKNYISNVTKMEKKGTKFVTDQGDDIGYDFCISLDIFPLDKLAPGKMASKMQIRHAWVLNKLIFLRGSANPIIPLHGAAEAAAKAIIHITHAVLKFLRVSPAFLYRRLEKVSQKYRDSGSEYYTILNSPTASKEVISESELFPLKEMYFEDVSVKVPNQYDRYLTRMYGDYMQLPPEEQRVNHGFQLLDFGEENI